MKRDFDNYLYNLSSFYKKLECRVVEMIYFDDRGFEEKCYGPFKTIIDAYKYILNHEKKWKKDFGKDAEALSVNIQIIGYNNDSKECGVCKTTIWYKEK